MKPSNGTSQPAGFVIVPCGVLTSHDLSPLELRLWIVLRMHCIDSDKCFPSIKRLAALLGITERWVYDLLKSLERKGFVEIISRPGKTSIFKPKVPNEDTTALSSEEEAHPGTPLQGSDDTPELQFTPPLNYSSENPGTTVHPELDEGSRLIEVDGASAQASLRVPTEETTVATKTKSAKRRHRKKASPITDPQELSIILQSTDLSAIKEEFDPQGLDVDRLWKRFCQTTINGNAKKDGPNPYGYVNFKAAFRDWCEREAKGLGNRTSSPQATTPTCAAHRPLD